VKLGRLVVRPTIDSIRLLLRNLMNPWMIALLYLSLLSVGYVLVILLLILIMNMLNNYCMLLMILFEV
jgi:hypothetical protein